MSQGQDSPTIIRVRNLRLGEAATLPPALLDHGMPYLDEQWVWVVEMVATNDPALPALPALPAPPFALLVCSFAHGWLLLWRLLSISPLPSTAPLNWIMTALPQIFAAARMRGCVGFVTFLSGGQPQEVKLARIITRLGRGRRGTGGTLPFSGVIGAGMFSQD